MSKERKKKKMSGYFNVKWVQKESKKSTPENPVFTNYLVVELVKEDGKIFKFSDPVFLKGFEADYLDILGIEKYDN